MNFLVALALLGCCLLGTHGWVLKAVEQAKSHHQYVARAATNDEVEVMFSVKHSNSEHLEAELLKVSDPHSPTYGKHWSKQEVIDFTRNDASTAAVRSYMKANGIAETIEKATGGDLYLFAKASVSTWESLLGAEFHEYINGNTKRKLLRSDEMTIPKELCDHVTSLSGVVNFPPPIEWYGTIHQVDVNEDEESKRVSHSSLPGAMDIYSKTASASANKVRNRMEEGVLSRGKNKRRVMHKARTAIFDAHSTSKLTSRRLQAEPDDPKNPEKPYLKPPFLLNYLGVDSSYLADNSANQEVYEALKQSFDPDDLKKFQQKFNLVEKAAISIGEQGHDVVGGCAGSNLNNCLEGTLDIQYIMAVAQGSETYYDYDSNYEHGWLVSWAQGLNAREEPISVASISYGAPESAMSGPDLDSFATEAMKLGLRGTTIVAASGDNGANGSGVKKSGVCEAEKYNPQYPATCPYVLAVGATQGPENDEVESACSSSTGGLITTGGGFSGYWDRPSYQDEAVGGYLNHNSPPKGFNEHGRGYPDLSNLGHNYIILINGETEYLGKQLSVSGTSASAPVTAAMLTIINGKRKASGHSYLGFLNPNLYSLINKAPLIDAFRDVVKGDNYCVESKNAGEKIPPVCCKTGFSATYGWDPTTGFGTPIMGPFYAGLTDPGITAYPTFPPTPGPTLPTSVPTISPTRSAMIFDQKQMQGLSDFCDAVGCQKNFMFNKVVTDYDGKTLGYPWSITKTNGDLIGYPCGEVEPSTGQVNAETKWFGVTCDETGDNVIGLSYNGTTFDFYPDVPPPLVGTLPDTLFSGIPSLEVLQLKENKLYGTLPASLGTHKKLKYLDLNSNSFSGYVPDPHTKGDLEALEVIDLMWNKLTGEFPDTYATLENLRVLDFSKNSLKGIIPHTLTAIDSLEVLSLEENQLTGTLPAYITGGALKELRLGNNELSGEIPNYQGIDSLSLSGNKKLDIAMYADRLSSVPRLDVSVINCQFPDALVNAARTTFSISSMYTAGNDQKCKLNSTEVATWGVIKSTQLEELAFLGGFQLNFTSDIVDVLVNEGGASLKELMLSDVPIGPKYLRRELYHGHLTGIRNTAVNDVVQPIFPGNIGSLHKLEVIIAAYGRGIYPPAAGTKNMIMTGSTLPASLKNLSALQLLMMPNYKYYLYGAGSLPLEDPHGVLPALIAKNTLYVLDIRGNNLDMDMDDLMNEKLLPASSEELLLQFLLLGGNDLYTDKESADQEWLKVLSRFYTMRVFDLGNTLISTSTSDFDFQKWWICSHMILSNTYIYGGLPGLSRPTRVFEGSNTWMSGALVTENSDLGDLASLEVFAVANNTFSGSLPDSSRFAYSVEVLDFKHNQLAGSIPADYAVLQNLKALSIGHNKLTGDVPDMKNPHLKVMSIENNDLTGGLDTMLGGVPGLEQLWTAQNPNMGGTIPDTLLTMKEIEFVNADGNGLTGTIQDALGEVTSLQTLRLSDNSLTGNLHSCGLLARAENDKDEAGGGFQFIDIRDNPGMGCYELCWYEKPETLLEAGNIQMCQGTLPKEEQDLLYNMAGLLYLTQLNWNFTMNEDNTRYLSNPCVDGWLGLTCTSHGDNWAIGEIDLHNVLRNATITYPVQAPESIINMHEFIPMLAGFKSLYSLDMSDNYLVGPLPDVEWGTTALTKIDLSNNALTGSVPFDKLLNRLEYLDLSYNHFTGELPAAAFTDFETFLAPGNSFTGTIPEVPSGSVMKISKLNLNGNSISGGIPESYLNAANCQSGIFMNFQMSSNALTGTVPASLGKSCFAMSLKVVQLDDNKLTGSIPSMNALKSLVVWTTENNQFTGAFPDSSSMVGLVTLGMQVTKDQPTLPSAEMLPPNMFYLKLSTNMDDGAIPSLTMLQGAKMLILQLTGGFKGEISEGFMNTIGTWSLRHLGFTPSYYKKDGDISGAMFHPRYTYEGKGNPNALTGVFPTWSDPKLPVFRSYIFSVHLSHNEFTGPFPPLAFRNMSAVRFAAGANNKFDSVDFSRDGGTMWPESGTVACDLSNNDLSVADSQATNYFSDHIIHGSPGKRFFQDLKMANMGFSGEISDYICDDLISWNYTAFGDNKYTGSIEYLDLAGNNFDCYAYCLTTAVTNPRALANPFYFRSNTNDVCSSPPTLEPTPEPTMEPTKEGSPTVEPTSNGRVPTVEPTMQPTSSEGVPTITPTMQPTSSEGVPTIKPTMQPTAAVSAAPTGTSQNTATYSVLKAMYTGFQGVENRRFDTWDFTLDKSGAYISNPCTDQWWGLVCDENGDITEIKMVDSQVTGTIPVELGALQSLTKINLANNEIERDLPSSIFGLSQLWSLDVHSNRLDGNVGDVLGLSRSVNSIDLSSNSFTGPVSDLSNALSLEKLNLADNQFTGNTKAFDTAYRLFDLDISSNTFSGPFLVCHMAQLSYSKQVKLNLKDNSGLVCLADCWDLADIDTPPGITKDESLGFCSAEVPDDEIMSLKKLYEGMELEHAHPSFRETWIFDTDNNDGKTSPCEWFGLKCGVGDDGAAHISSLDFGDMKLYNTSYDYYTLPYYLPDCVVDLVNEFSYLTELDFSNNNMHPSKNIVDISTLTFAGLQNVETLLLNGNALFGNFSLAFPLDRMPKLHTLDISNGVFQAIGNAFVGGLPCEVFRRMKVLRAKKGNLYGNFFPENCELPSDVPLEEINVSGNYMSGALPWKLFGAAKNLKTFAISNNIFSFGIPENIINLEYLEVLELDGNYLAGGVPADMNKMTQLKTLCLNDNYLTFGDLMPDFSSMPVLQTFGFSIANNSIPFDKLPAAWVFKISNTATGNVPDVSGMPISTQALAFTSGFSGDTIREGVFEELAQLSNLVVLSFSDYEVNLGANNQDTEFYDSGSMSPNYFPSTIPQAIDVLKDRLVMVSFHGCTIVEEGLPTALKDFSKLTALYLGNNNFTGTLDATGFEWKNLHTIDLSNNDFVGGWPYELFADDFYWEHIDLSNNKQLGAGDKNGSISGQLCQYLESDYHTEADNKFVLKSAEMGGTAFTCYDPCYNTASLRDMNKYGFYLDFPDEAEPCEISDQLFALHGVYTDLIHTSVPASGFASWEDLFSVTPDPCGVADDNTAGPYRGLSCDADGNVVKIDLSSSSLVGHLPYMANFGLGLPNLTTLDLHDNSLTGPMVYSIGTLYNYGDGTGPPVPRYNNVAISTDDIRRKLFQSDSIFDIFEEKGAYPDRALSRIRMRLSTLENKVANIIAKMSTTLSDTLEMDKNVKFTQTDRSLATDDSYDDDDYAGTGWDTSVESHLCTLDVSGNKLTGSLMPSLASFRKLETLNLADNKFTGTFSVFDRQDTWEYLTMSDFSNNEFGGEFSACALAKEMKDYSGASATSKIVAIGNGGLTCLSSCWDDVVHETGKDPASSIVLEVDSAVKLCNGGEVDPVAMAGLENFYSIMSLRNLPKFAGWDFSKNSDGDYLKNPCNDAGKPWVSVECNTGNDAIIGLNFEHVLANVDADGVMSPLSISDAALSSLADIMTLATLDMSRNNIVGALPSTINELANLEVLTLNNNLFNGAFPVDLSQMTKLKSVTLSYGNKFTGTLGSDWYCRMTHFDVKMNSFEGAIPANLGALCGESSTGTSTSNLKLLNVYGNKLNGPIPDDFFTSAPLLTDLVLSVNQLTGTLPSTIGNLRDMEILDIDGNYFSGSLPSQLSQLTAIKSMQLNDNSFTGALPNMRSLEKCTNFGFALNDQQLNVPDENKLPPNLWVLKLSQSGSTRAVPERMILPKALQGVALTGGFEGELTEEFFDELSLLKNLVIFALSDYDYSMTMNGQDPYVQGSRISNNFCAPGDTQSGCKVPEAFEKIVDRLIMISIAFNNFNDYGIPMPLRKASTATSIYMENNKFSGPFKLTDADWGHLQVLNIAENNFSGDIHSDAFGENAHWVKIDISNNNLLVGHIDSTLCDQIVSPENESGTLEYIDISGTGIACFAQCFLQAAKSDYLLTLNYDEDNSEVCEDDPQLNALQELCGGIHCHQNPLFDSWNFDHTENGDIASDPCTDGWYGITCDARSTPENRLISELNLGDSGISGALDDSISQLEHLVKLNISHNNIRGFLPNSLWTIQGLEQFDAHSNVLQGMIDDYDFKTGGLLKLLDLGDNKIVGQIPPSLRNLEQLECLDLSKNTLFDMPSKVSGSMAIFDGYFPRLKELRLQDNELGGELHACSLLDTLTYLNIEDNDFECADACWSDALGGEKAGLTMVYDWNLILCGSSHYPTMKPSLPPTAAPTRVPAPTAKPTTAAPTTNDLSIVDVSALFEVDGVSAGQWAENRDLFDQVFKEALVMSIANSYITIDNVKAVVVTPIEEAIVDRRLALRFADVVVKENTSLRHNRQLDDIPSVEVTARVLAGDVIGDTSETVSNRIKAKTESGEFTTNLRARAEALGATDLEEADVEEFKKSDSGPGTSSENQSLGVGAITGIAFGVFACGVLIAVAYFLVVYRDNENEKERDEETGIDTTSIATVASKGRPSHGSISEVTVNPMQRTAPPAPTSANAEDGGKSNEVKSFAKGSSIARESDVVPDRTPPVLPRDSASTPHRKKSILSSISDSILGGPAPDPSTPSAEPRPGELAEEAEDGDDISPMHGGEYGGQNFSRPMPSKAQRSPSILARRDTIPADAMASAAAEATASVDDVTPSVTDPPAPVAAGAGSGGLKREDFFKKKRAKAKESDKPITGAPDNFEEL